jgi:hypothetical protein
MRGDPANSKNIFNKMKSVSGKDSEVSPRIAVPEEKINTSINNFVGEGGAFASMRGKSYQERSKTRESVLEAPVQISKKKVKVGRLVESCLEFIQLDAEIGDHRRVVDSLYKLYVNNNLEEYEISGIDKEEIFGILEDFKTALEDVLLD